MQVREPRNQLIGLRNVTYTGLTCRVSAVTFINENIIEYEVNQQLWCVHDFDILETVNSVLLRKCWKNFLKIAMHILLWLIRRKKIWSTSLFCDIKILKV